MFVLSAAVYTSLLLLSAFSRQPENERPENGPTDLYAPTKSGAKFIYESRTSVQNKEVDRSEYSRLVRSVVKKDQTLTLLVDYIENGKTIMVNKIAASTTGLSYCGYDGIDLRTPLIMLRLPHKAKNKWTTKITWGVGLEVEVECTDAGEEVIEVPAGKFASLRVESKVAGVKEELRATTWYAKGIGPVKSIQILGTQRTEIVLKSFTPRK